MVKIYVVYAGGIEPKVIMVTLDEEYARKTYKTHGVILEIWGNNGEFYERLAK